MKVALIGNGAIARYVMAKQNEFEVVALLLRPASAQAFSQTGVVAVSQVSDLPEDVRLVVDCAGHAALRSFGPDILRSGRSLITVSIGALAEDALLQELTDAATAGQTNLHLTSGAIGGLDCLRSARIGALSKVTYVGRKPPSGWIGSPAEDVLDLAMLGQETAMHFKGSARDAALRYPKNANVAAAVALAGLGFDNTSVELIADPTISKNIHEIHAEGDFGKVAFRIDGETLPGNPRTSALAAMSVVSKINELSAVIRF